MGSHEGLRFPFLQRAIAQLQKGNGGRFLFGEGATASILR